MKSISRIILLSALVVMMFPIYTIGKNPIASKSALQTFSGSIMDKSTKEDLGGVYLYFEELQKGIYSGPDGKFNLEGIEPGDYNITAKFISYHEKKISVKIGKATDNYTEILLEPIQP
jgi:hypothetical protein